MLFQLLNCLTFEIIIIIVVIVGFILSVGIILKSVAIGVVWFVSLSILVPPRHNDECYYANQCYHNVDKVIDKTTDGKCVT